VSLYLFPTTDHPVSCSSKISDLNYVPNYNHNTTQPHSSFHSKQSKESSLFMLPNTLSRKNETHHDSTTNHCFQNQRLQCDSFIIFLTFSQHYLRKRVFMFLKEKGIIRLAIAPFPNKRNVTITKQTEY